MITYILSWFRPKRDRAASAPVIRVTLNCPGVFLIGPYDWPTGPGEAA
ncbi:hypothetical protein [Pelagibacterium luteolum]|uniref:Uncharacterized protein n=1 Tax=Pelagibacterium luteolum TaxID=440168 RepID=A0A1G7TIH7_9HYPH|nr:hypothetical protein [Pelagibacterium luteolum]SDG35011.1 hypothetical protein SAMN04487974_102145 [Pelagibacterium luteolum]